MNIAVEQVGAVYTTQRESGISELSLAGPGLRVVVLTSPNASVERLWIEYHFDSPRGFRFLDEGDLLRYWGSHVFAGGYHLFKIVSGGWKEQELQLPGMLTVTDAIGTCQEWFICTSNQCLNVLSVNPPLVREFTE